MKELYQITQQAKQQDPEAMKEILHLFEPKIKKTSRFVHPSNREDLEQELKIQLVKAVDRFDAESTPNFWEFLDQLRTSSS